MVKTLPAQAMMVSCREHESFFCGLSDRLLVVKWNLSIKTVDRILFAFVAPVMGSFRSFLVWCQNALFSLDGL